MARSNYPNMSYCMFENTQLALEQIVAKMQEAVGEGTVQDFFMDLSSDERRAMSELFDLTEQFRFLSNHIWERADQEEWHQSA